MGCSGSKGEPRFGGHDAPKQMTFKVDTSAGSIFDKQVKEVPEVIRIAQASPQELKQYMHQVEVSARISRDDAEHTVLLAAVRDGQPDIVKMILQEFPADFDLKDANRSGDTALHLGARNNDMLMVELLLNAGADLTVKNNFGKIPREMADDEEIRTKLFDVYNSLVIE